MTGLDAACHSCIRWMRIVEVLVCSFMAIKHVDVATTAVIIIQALVMGGPCSQRFPLEVPLLIGAVVAVVHIHVAIAAHVQALVVIIGL